MASLVAGLLLLVNFQAKPESVYLVDHRNLQSMGWSRGEADRQMRSYPGAKLTVVTRRTVGWPMIAWKDELVVKHQLGTSTFDAELRATALSIDIASNLAILLFALWLIEYMTRRRERKRAP